jgi:hypothetical protein
MEKLGWSKYTSLGWGFPIWWVSLYFQTSQKQEFATPRGSTHNSLPPWTELASSREVPTIVKQVDRDTALGHVLVPTPSPLPPSESWFAAGTSFSTPLVVPSLVKNVQDLWRNLHLMGSYHITPVTTLWTDVLLQGFASSQTILQTYNAVWFLKAKLPVETGSMLILLNSRKELGGLSKLQRNYSLQGSYILYQRDAWCVLEVTSLLGSHLHMDPSSNRMIQRNILHQTLTSKNFWTYATKSLNQIQAYVPVSERAYWTYSVESISRNLVLYFTTQT